MTDDDDDDDDEEEQNKKKRRRNAPMLICTTAAATLLLLLLLYVLQWKPMCMPCAVCCSNECFLPPVRSNECYQSIDVILPRLSNQ